MEKDVKSPVLKNIEKDSLYRSLPAVNHSLLTAIEKGKQEEKVSTTLPMLKGTVFHYLMETDDTSIIDHTVEPSKLISKSSKAWNVFQDHLLKGTPVDEAYCEHYEKDVDKYLKVKSNLTTEKTFTKAEMTAHDKVQGAINALEATINFIKEKATGGLDMYGDDPDLWFKGRQICEEALTNYYGIKRDAFWQKMNEGAETWSEVGIVADIPLPNGSLIKAKGKLDKLILKNKVLTVVDFKSIGKGLEAVERSAVVNRNVRQASWYVTLLKSSDWFKALADRVEHVEAHLLFVNEGKVRHLPLSSRLMEMAETDRYIKPSPFNWYNMNSDYIPYLSEAQMGFLRNTLIWETPDRSKLVRGWRGLLDEAAILYPDLIIQEQSEDYEF